MTTEEIKEWIRLSRMLVATKELQYANRYYLQDLIKAVETKPSK